MKTVKWIRPSGAEIETNADEATIDYCVSLGWKPAEKPKPKKKVAKRGSKKSL